MHWAGGRLVRSSVSLGKGVPRVDGDERNCGDVSGNESLYGTAEHELYQRFFSMLRAGNYEACRQIAGLLHDLAFI